MSRTWKVQTEVFLGIKQASVYFFIKRRHPLELLAKRETRCGVFVKNFPKVVVSFPNQAKYDPPDLRETYYVGKICPKFESLTRNVHQIIDTTGDPETVGLKIA